MNRLQLSFVRWLFAILCISQLVGPATAYAAPTNQRSPLRSELARLRQTTAAAIANRDQVAQAVVRIEAEGTFVDPVEGRWSGAGGGSGFIVHPSGIAVTNNHVVTGAAILRVYVPGEEEPRHARVLGVDECADLAVIKIEGDNFPYLDWYDGEVKQGLAVFAVGYPGTDIGTESTMTAGIVERAHSDGQTDWASLEYVLQHGATLNPGNSGGPLVDERGRVVGVNYASNHDANQYFAISRDLALPIIEQLQTGVNLTSVGINGQALTDGSTYAGVWVYSVRSGSPADNAKIRPGDFIFELEGLTVGEDGTLETYCNILRSHGPEDIVSIRIARNDEIWAGQLNGRPMQREDSPLPTPEPTPTGGEVSYIFQPVSNDVIHAILPTKWADTHSDDWVVDEQVFGRTFAAASDLDGFQAGWETSGVIFFVKTGVQEAIDINEWLDAFDLSTTCERGSREQHAHTSDGQSYVGAYDIWLNCADTNNVFVRLVAVSEPADQLVIIQFNGTLDADVEAWHTLLESFSVPGNPAPAPATPTPVDPIAQMKQQPAILDEDLRRPSARIETESERDIKYTRTQRGLNILVEAPKLVGWSAADVTVGNFLAETEVSLVDPAEGMNYGLVFRLVDNENFYQFAVNLLGEYSLWKIENGEWSALIEWEKSGLLKSDATARNLLGVMTQGAQISLLANNQILAQINDPTFAQGQIGLAVETFDEANAQVTFHSLRIWTTKPEEAIMASTASTPVAPTPTAPAQVMAIVQVNDLNLRSGPGTGYPVIDHVDAAEQLTVLGQVNNCEWLQVQTPQQQIGWVSGAASFVTLAVACRHIPVVPVPPPPPVAQGQGCIYFQNNVNAELTITFTTKAGTPSGTFKVGRKANKQQCFAPGDYTYTIDAPPPRDALNGEISIAPGARINFPVN